MLTLVFCVIVVALAFEFINGFHDTANAIATSVGTKVLTPAQAILLSTVFNLAGALAGVAVAKTIGKDLVDAKFISSVTVLAALTSGITWNLVTWYYGLPSSSSHALFGGLCGAALASAHGNWAVIKWSTGLWPKIVKPMVVAPATGLLVGFLIMSLLMMLLQRIRPRIVNLVFGKAQLLSAAWMSFEHGRNDAQKTMGIIALTLFTASTQSEVFANLPEWLSFLKIQEFKIDLWVKVTCALTMAAGTAAGGWKIIRTLGKHMVKLQPIHGFAAQTTAASVIGFATHFGIPLSTTHVISSSIMGVGATKRLNAVKWPVVERMVWAWLMTLPITAFLAWLILNGLRAIGL
ncbi:MAG: inorganic phosphate transporter [Verrucomicrobia subdivision 3 bacterium]|nr:inorganic phosphate transporter [Limisphaerales bacterium]